MSQLAEQIEALRPMVKADSVGGVVLALGRLCCELAEDAQIAGDVATALMWRRAEETLDNAAAKLP